MAFGWGGAGGAAADAGMKQQVLASELENQLAERAYRQALIEQAKQQQDIQRQRMSQEQQQFDVEREDRATAQRQATNQRGVIDQVGQFIRTNGITAENRPQIVGTLMEAGRMPTQADLEMPGGGDPFTLGPGQVRYGPDGKQIAAGLTPAGETPDPFTLSPGQIRYGADGKVIARGAPQQSAASGSGQTADPNISKYTLETATRTIKAVDDVMPDINGWTAGWVGSAMSNIPGTKAANVSAELSSVASNIAFNALQAMRDASKTGGALGQVSERELDLLSSVEGSIRQNQSPDNLKMQLQKVRESMDRVRQAATASGQAIPAGTPRQQWTRDANGRPVPVK